MTDRADQDAMTGRNDPWLLAAIGINLCFFAGFFAYGALRNYSFWTDELASVTAALMPFSQMMEVISLDAHPPAYQMGLFLWVRVFGASELSVRGLSLLFGALSILAFLSYRHFLTRPQFLMALTAFTSSTPLVFFSQEARNYTIIVLFATLAFSAFIRRRETPLIAASVLLGVTHYFGFLLGAAILAWVFFADGFSRWGLKVKILLAGLVMSAWPLAQIVLGFAGNKLGGQFWITSDPLAAIPQLTEAVFHYYYMPIWWAVVQLGLPWPIIGLSSLALLGLVALAVLLRRGESGVLLRAAYCLFLVLGLAMAINSHTPISTMRNFIVLLPVASIILGIALFPKAEQVALWHGILALAIALSSAFFTYDQIVGSKTRPYQNWRDAAGLAASAVNETGGTLYFHYPILWQHPDWITASYAHYLPEGTSGTLIRDAALDQLTAGDVILFSDAQCETLDGAAENTLIRNLRADGWRLTLAMPEQRDRCTVGTVTLGE